MAPTLFDEVTLSSDAKLSHRIVMSAMTRLRGRTNGDATPSMAEYYAQRASPGILMISEGTYPIPAGRGYERMPGIATSEHAASWKQVTAAVHANDAKIFCQLMHSGRVSHSSLQPGKALPVAPSALKMAGAIHTPLGKVPYETPRALETEEVADVVAGFAHAARHAVEAGFDGIELHVGNGYILQEFLAEKTNMRTDMYGGSLENRCRLVLECIDACGEAIGFHRVAIKVQPGVTFSDLVETEEDSFAQLRYLGEKLSGKGLAYVCVTSLNGAYFSRFLGMEKPHFEKNPWREFRKAYDGTLMVNGAISAEDAKTCVEEGIADLVAFATMFIATPDLPKRIKEGKEVNMGGADMKTWYAKPGFTEEQDRHFYVDW